MLIQKDTSGTPTGDFHPISSCPCRAYTTACSGRAPLPRASELGVRRFAPRTNRSTGDFARIMRRYVPIMHANSRVNSHIRQNHKGEIVWGFAFVKESKSCPAFT